MSLPRFLAGALLAFAILFAQPCAAVGRKAALVIGNATYVNGPLANPVNDARAMATKLSSLGFQVVKVENFKRDDITRTINGFVKSVQPGDTVLVFYAGHGVQVKGLNYFPAVDADIQHEDDVPLNSLNLNTLMDRLDEAKASIRLFFLDACRNNPYARSFRSADRGLAAIGAAPSGTLLHFATRPGSVAADGTGKNGLYTSHLLKHIDVPGLPVEVMLKRVASGVDTESKGLQSPWAEGTLQGDFYFKEGLPLLASNALSGPNWSARLNEMKVAFSAAEKMVGSLTERAAAWTNFLSAWSENIPTSGEDEGMRLRAMSLRDVTLHPPRLTRTMPASGEKATTWTWPLDGEVVRTRAQSDHTGLTIQGKQGDPVFAAADGKISYFGAMGKSLFSDDSRFRYYVVIQHNSTYKTTYIMRELGELEAGQPVARGTVLGRIGSTGKELPALSFEINRNGWYNEDPREFLPVR